MNQRLLHKDCVAKIVIQRLINQRLLRKGEDFYGVNLSKNLVKHLSKNLVPHLSKNLVKHLSKNLVPHLSKNLVPHLSKNLTKYLMKYLPNPESEIISSKIHHSNSSIQRSTYRWSSSCKGYVWFDLEKIRCK